MLWFENDNPYSTPRISLLMAGLQAKKRCREWLFFEPILKCKLRKILPVPQLMPHRHGGHRSFLLAFLSKWCAFLIHFYFHYFKAWKNISSRQAWRNYKDSYELGFNYIFWGAKLCCLHFMSRGWDSSCS